jgi:hypothetical protein
MTIATLYISHQNFDWQSLSNSVGIFVNRTLINKFLNDSDKHTCHSTLEDLDYKLHELDDLISKSEKICLIDLDENFIDVIPDTSLYLYLYFFNKLKKINDTNKVQNFDWQSNINKNLFIQLVDCRHSGGQTLWITGCSVTYGTGVDKTERYPALLEEKLGLPTVVLAQPGSTIAWQADQLLQSDIRKEDLVVWGLTSFSRINYADGTTWACSSVGNYLRLPPSKQYWTLDYFNSATQSIPSIKNILQVMNFCQKIGAKLYLVNLLESTWVDFIFGQDDNYLDLTLQFNSKQEYIYLDRGTDNRHPGPLQHKQYAEEVYNFIKENNRGKTI